MLDFTTETDRNVLSFAGQFLDQYKLWPDDGARWNVKGSTKLCQFMGSAQSPLPCPLLKGSILAF